MTRYYDKRKNKVISTDEIPDWLLAKKTFLLPYELEIINVVKGEEPPKKAGLEVFEDKVIETKINWLPTFEEKKAFKLKSLNSYLSPKFPAEYKQRNVGLGVYTGDKALEIVNEVKKWRDYFNDFEAQILACTTEAELDAIDFRTEEDKLKEEMLI